MRSRYWSLLKKEFSASKSSFILLLFLIIIWDLFLLTRQNVWDKTLIFGLSMTPIIILPFYALVSGFFSFREEWQKKTICFQLSLPVRGVTLTSVKLLVVLIETVIFITIVFTGGMIFGKNVLPAPIPIQGSIQIGLILAMVTLVLTTMSQFAYLAGRLFHRFRWLISIWVFLLTGWGISRFSGYLAISLSWIPDVQLNGWLLSGVWQYLGENSSPLTIGIRGPVLAAWLFSYLIIFLIGSWFLEKYIEI